MGLAEGPTGMDEGDEADEAGRASNGERGVMETIVKSSLLSGSGSAATRRDDSDEHEEDDEDEHEAYWPARLSMTTRKPPHVCVISSKPGTRSLPVRLASSDYVGNQP